MKNCWKQDPEDRPTFSEIHQTLSTLMEEKSSDNYISMTGIDLCPIECAQGEDEGSDQLEQVGSAESQVLVEDETFEESEEESRVVVVVHWDPRNTTHG